MEDRSSILKLSWLIVAVEHDNKIMSDKNNPNWVGNAWWTEDDGCVYVRHKTKQGTDSKRRLGLMKKVGYSSSAKVLGSKKGKLMMKFQVVDDEGEAKAFLLNPAYAAVANDDDTTQAILDSKQGVERARK